MLWLFSVLLLPEGSLLCLLASKVFVLDVGKAWFGPEKYLDTFLVLLVEAAAADVREC